MAQSPKTGVRFRLPDIKPGTTFTHTGTAYTVATISTAPGYWRCRINGATGRKLYPFSARVIRQAIKDAMPTKPEPERVSYGLNFVDDRGRAFTVWAKARRMGHWRCNQIDELGTETFSEAAILRHLSTKAKPEPAIKAGQLFTCNGCTYQTISRGRYKAWTCKNVNSNTRIMFTEQSILKALVDALAAGLPENSPPAHQATAAPAPKAGFRDLDRLNEDLGIIRRRLERTSEMITAGELDLLRMAVAFTHGRYELLAHRMRDEAELAASIDISNPKL